MKDVKNYFECCIESISKEIEAIKEEGGVADEGVSIVSYYSYDRDLNYKYYRLVSKEPIFKGKDDKMVRTKQLGKEDSLATRNAVESVNRRKKIKALQKILTYVEKSLNELERMGGQPD